MALAVTIFGLTERSSPGIFVYAYLRVVRGSATIHRRLLRATSLIP
jgi:hypothetical protein